MIFQPNIGFPQPSPAPSSSTSLGLICLFMTHKRHVPSTSTLGIVLTKWNNLEDIWSLMCEEICPQQPGDSLTSIRSETKGGGDNYKLTDIIVIKLNTTWIYRGPDYIMSHFSSAGQQ